MVREQGLDGLGIDRCRIEVAYYFPTRARHDADNYTIKWIGDGLDICGLLVDDSFSVVKRLSILGEIDKANPRTEIKIEGL